MFVILCLSVCFRNVGCWHVPVLGPVAFAQGSKTKKKKNWSRRNTVGVGPTPYKWFLPELDLHLSRERAALAPPLPDFQHWPLWFMASTALRGLLKPCTGGCSWRLIALWGSLTWVWERTPGDWWLSANSTCRSRALGTTGAACSPVARATTPGPPPQPHGWVRLGFEVTRFLHFGGGGGWHVPTFPGVWSFGAL